MTLTTLLRYGLAVASALAAVAGCGVDVYEWRGLPSEVVEEPTWDGTGQGGERAAPGVYLIRIDVDGRWVPVEAFILDHSEAVLSHGVCPECKQAHYAKVLE